MIEITDSLKNETTAWADQVIERFKTAMRSGETYLRWNEPLMYRKGGDAWVDESWWIETARELFAKQNRKYNINSALEILVYHYPEQFGVIALERIEEWYKDPGDIENWENLIALTNLYHPVLSCIPTDAGSIIDLAFLANFGHLKAVHKCRSLMRGYLTEKNWFCIWEFLYQLNNQVILGILSEKTINQIHEEAKVIALQKTDPDKYDHFQILLPAIKLGWEDVIDELSKNLEFFYYLEDQILYFGGANSLCYRIILEWSLSSKRFFTQQLVLISKRVIDISPFLDKINVVSKFDYSPINLTERDKLEKSIQLAIAWKRSLKI
jgi:hypothetical protein